MNEWVSTLILFICHHSVQKDSFAFTFIRQDLPCSEKFVCYFWLSNTDRKCTASADINTCCLRSVCRSRATFIVSTIKTFERKYLGYCVVMYHSC